MWLSLLRFSIGLILLFLMLYLGKLMSWLVPIGIAESIWGLLILFTALVFKVIKLEWITPATRPLIRYMALFFLPISAGIIDQGELLGQHFHTLLLANFLSTVLSLILLGWLAQWLFKRAKAKQAEENDE